MKDHHLSSRGAIAPATEPIPAVKKLYGKYSTAKYFVDVVIISLTWMVPFVNRDGPCLTYQIMLARHEHSQSVHTISTRAFRRKIEIKR